MSWADRLFAWLRGATADGAGPADDLSPLRARLRLVATALAGEAIDVKPTDGAGGWRGDDLHLPSTVGESAAPAIYLFRVAYAVASRRAGFRIAGPIGAEERLLATLLAVAPTLDRLDRDLPGSVPLRRQLAARALASRPDPRTLSPRAAALELLARATLGDREADPAIDPRARSWAERAAHAVPDDRPSLLADLTRLPGAPRDLPSPVPLWGELLSPSPAEAPTPPRAPWLPFVQRSNRRPAIAATVNDENADDRDPLADGDGNGNASDDGNGNANDDGNGNGDPNAALVVGGRPGPFLYDEWDDRRRAYRLDWCTVQVAAPPVAARPAEAEAAVALLLHERRREVAALRAAFQRLARPRRMRPGMRDGEEVDLDALVDRHAALRAGHSPSEKLYFSRQRPRGDLATFLLLDGSLSTLLQAGGRPIVDVVRESVLVLGEALAAAHELLAVAAFSSVTRHACRFEELKRFDEPWSRARPRLARLEPRGYSRIGPAVRHAARLLAAAPARRRVLLLLSDGKPMDVDPREARYEGRYGIADVRQALREATRTGLHVFALAIDDEARQWLPQLFGRGRYEVLSDPSQLAQRLARLHRDLLRG